MIHLEAQDAWDIYPTVLNTVLRRGRPRKARDMPTRDAGMMVIELASPERALLAGLRPNYGTKVAAAEAIQLIGGFHEPRLMLDASPKFSEYVEPHGQFHGAYGNRVDLQVPAAIQKLVSDRDTRQAVITLWDPMLDNQCAKKDYPCTVALRFEIVRGTLNMDTIMRSNDAWLGLPYDLFQFTQLHLTVARALEIPAGMYRHTTWSMHIYEQDVDACATTAGFNPKAIVPMTELPRGFETPGIDPVDRFRRAMSRAKHIASGGTFTETTPSEEWYRVRVAPATVNVG